LKPHRRLALVTLTLLAGCAHASSDREREPSQWRRGPTVTPDAEPVEPQVPHDDRPGMNTEYFLGTRESEAAQFAEFARQIHELQRKASTERSQPLQRGFHAKSHACLNGELRLDPRRDPRTRFGLFADGQDTKKIVARFSNGVGWRQPDSELDARGLAFKVFDVAGPKYLPDEQDTQDFLMTTSPTPVGRDAVEFMEFARANANGRVAGLFFLAGHATTAAQALARTNPVDSMVTERYWSGGAYHLGAHQAVKYSTRPCDLRLVREPSRSSDDYLRDDLVLAAAKDGVCMTLYVQLQTDPDKTPIENASKVWEETDSPILPVARLVMPPQVVEPSATPACDALAFTPWHSVPAHKPMGHINRARRFVYEASQTLRRGH
jgi:hypothetical protein